MEFGNTYLEAKKHRQTMLLHLLKEVSISLLLVGVGIYSSVQGVLHLPSEPFYGVFTILLGLIALYWSWRTKFEVEKVYTLFRVSIAFVKAMKSREERQNA